MSKRQSYKDQSSRNKAAPDLQRSLRSSHVMFYDDCELQAFSCQPGKKARSIHSDLDSPTSLTLVLHSGLERSSAYKCGTMLTGLSVAKPSLHYACNQARHASEQGVPRCSLTSHSGSLPGVSQQTNAIEWAQMLAAIRESGVYCRRDDLWLLSSSPHFEMGGVADVDGCQPWQAIVRSSWHGPNRDGK